MDKIIEFFVNLYEQFIALSWVQLVIDYCKANPILAGVIGGLVVLIIIVLCIMGGRRRKAKKAAKKAKKLAKQQAKKAKKNDEISADALIENATTEEPAPVEETVEEVAAAEETAPVEETVEEVATAEEPTPVEETVEEVAVAEETAPVKETVEEVAAAEETAPVEETVEEVAAAEEPAPVEEARPNKQLSRTEDVNETLAMAEDLDEDDDDILRDHYDEDETDRIARYKGKWVICRVITNDEECEEMYFFELHASNGEKLLESEEYTSYQGALRGIQTHKTNILKGNFKIAVTKKGDFIFKLLSGKNMLLCMGENYPTKARCQNAIDSTIRFAATAIIDENVQDILLKVPHEDDSPIEPLPENCTGKWVISTGVGAEGQKIFYFELFANNGERLLESEEYTTYTGAVNGIQTHKKNIEKNNFRITLTKRGDYIYKLLNGNGQLLCLGEHYRTKRLCQNAVESVKRFAMNSPMLAEENTK
ncbi:MAG: DUF1508 domain-containing protein [Clostridia bacterium]|nr:DUF1508 domain-containing protein [Clostridia bacterium]